MNADAPPPLPSETGLPFTVGSYDAYGFDANAPIAIPAPSVSGGATPYTFSIASGSLPPGTSLSAGAVAGASSANGSYTATIRIADAANRELTRTLQISILAPAAQTLTMTGYAPAYAATVGQASSLPAPTVTGGAAPYSFTATGGLTVDPATGAATLTPSASGIATYTVTARDSQNRTAIASFTISAAEPLQIAAAGGPYAATVGTPYAFAIPAVTGGRSPFTYASENVGDGSHLTFSGGTATFTPPAAGSIQQAIRVTDADGRTTVSPAITFEVANPLTVGYASTYYGIAGEAVAIVAPNLAGGTSPFSVATPAAGAGLTHQGEGAYSFTGAQGTYGPFATTFSDSVGRTATGSFGVEIAAPIVVTGYPSTHNGQGGVAGTIPAPTVTGGFGPYTYALASPPSGVTINATTGAISYLRPGGTYPLSVTVTDSRGNAGPVTAITLEVSQALELSYTLSNPIQVNLDATYVANRAGGTGPYTYALKTGSYPSGMTLQANGDITGQPLAAGSGSFSVEVTDSTGAKATSPVVTWSSSTIDDSAVWAIVSGVTVNGTTSLTPTQNKAHMSDGNYTVYNPSGGRSGTASGLIPTSTTVNFSSDATLSGIILRSRHQSHYNAGGPGTLVVTIKNAAGTTTRTVNTVVSAPATTFAFINIPFPSTTGIRSITFTATSSLDTTWSEIEWISP